MIQLDNHPGDRPSPPQIKTVPWLSSSRSDRHVLQRCCQPTPTPVQRRCQPRLTILVLHMYFRGGEGSRKGNIYIVVRVPHSGDRPRSGWRTEHCRTHAVVEGPSVTVFVGSHPPARRSRPYRYYNLLRILHGYISTPIPPKKKNAGRLNHHAPLSMDESPGHVRPPVVHTIYLGASGGLASRRVPVE